MGSAASGRWIGFGFTERCPVVGVMVAFACVGWDGTVGCPSYCGEGSSHGIIISMVYVVVGSG